MLMDRVISSDHGETEPVKLSTVLLLLVLLLDHSPFLLAQQFMPLVLVFLRPKSKMKETMFAMSKTNSMAGPILSNLLLE